MRGVHSFPSLPAKMAQGSSPHARGPFFVIWTHKPVRGIIPACAGSITQPCQLFVFIQDHPRMRGVHKLIKVKKADGQGSSPHARGPCQVVVCITPDGRIIPACAGSISANHTYDNINQDHPRMRGVHLMTVFLAISSKGSSPHARGPSTVDDVLIPLSRIIPACAGSIQSVNLSSLRS